MPILLGWSRPVSLQFIATHTSFLTAIGPLVPAVLVEHLERCLDRQQRVPGLGRLHGPLQSLGAEPYQGIRPFVVLLGAPISEVVAGPATEVPPAQVGRACPPACHKGCRSG